MKEPLTLQRRERHHEEEVHGDQSTVEEHAEEIKQRVETAEDLKATMRALEKEIAEEKEVIKARDDQIGVREKKIYELKKKNQELEKFKFVLDYKIKELKADRAAGS